jgi:hypothetical protein
MKSISTIIAVATFAYVSTGAVQAGVADVSNQADINHPNIHQNVGDGANANPNGVSPTGGANLHGIGNNPGQAGINPNDDGIAGFANELQSVHGGIGDVNPNALP